MRLRRRSATRTRSAASTAMEVVGPDAAAQLSSSGGVTRMGVPPVGVSGPVKVGSVEVTAVLDGGMVFAPTLFPKTSAEDAAKAQEAAFQEPGPIKAYLNTFVIKTGGKLILVDSGYGGEGGASVGKLMKNLMVAGYTPADFTDIYLTHAHPDHVSGLVDVAGGMVFPKAQLRLNETELQFWFDDAALAKAPEGAKGLFAAARKALTPYKEAERVATFKGGADLGQGISTINLAGHTPGHSGFRIADGKEQLVIWGDIVHAPVLQFAHPDWSIAFDTDAAQAAETRAKIFDEMATDRVRVAGMHLVFPALGHVSKAGTGYVYTPQIWEL